MPESLDNINAQQFVGSPLVANASLEEQLSVKRWDEICGSIPAAEWERFREFPQVAIGRLARGEEFRILGGFGRGPGDGLAELAASLPATAIYTISWHKDRLDHPGSIAENP